MFFLLLQCLFVRLLSRSLWRLNNRCNAKRAVTAVPEWLCQQQWWVWAFQPANHAGKRKREKEGKKTLPGPQMMPAGSHRVLNFAGWFFAVFCVLACGLWLTDTAILGLSAWQNPSSCVQQKQKWLHIIKKHKHPNSNFMYEFFIEPNKNLSVSTSLSPPTPTKKILNDPA